MSEKNDFIEGEKVDNQKTESSTTSYKPVTEFTVTSKKEKNNKSGFGKTVVIPFISGLVGGTLILGTCLGVPTIRNSILGNQNSNISNSLNTYTGINTDIISLKEYSETGIQVAAKVLPSVVGIKVEFPVSSIFNIGTTTATSSGSGVIISEDGYILTNNHVVSSSSSSSTYSYYEIGEASKVTVYLYNDETAYEGTIIGTDNQTDLAVIKIDKEGLTAATLGDSDSVQVGEFAMAIGNPLGMQSSVSAGIVSAVNREVTTDGVTYHTIQTDTAINSGNSGGALVNSKGEVIGINTLKLSGTSVEGLGFAIPINDTKQIYEQLIEFKKVKRPYIGITGRNLTEALAKANNLPVGIYIVSIDDFSSAEKAGLKIGDVILEADGNSVSTMNELNEIKNKHQIGDTMKLKINRNGTEQEVELILQEQ